MINGIIGLMRIVAIIGVIGILVPQGGSIAQNINFERYKIYDINSMVSFLDRTGRTKKAIGKSKNIPISYSMMGNKICGFYLSRPYGPFDMRGTKKLALNSTNFITCSEVGSKEDGEII
ncbi:MAG: hypothetical protein GXO48_07265, partial [Chlorobi bacterium]|nr:hypothetical protein [Chlorobiota bacterium]